MKDTTIDGIRRECLTMVASVLAQRDTFSEASRELCMVKVGALLDDLIRAVAVHTSGLGRRESRAVAQFTFTRAFPLVCAAYVPEILHAAGVDEAATKMMQAAMDVQRRSSAGSS